MQVHEGSDPDTRLKQTLNVVWEARVPSKIKIFGWRFFKDILPTKLQLSRRGIIHSSHDKMCVFCFRQEEDIDHVMINCPMMRKVWDKIQIWLETYMSAEDGFAVIL